MRIFCFGFQFQNHQKQMNDFFLVIGIAFLILTVILLFSNDDDCNRLINALIIILQIGIIAILMVQIYCFKPTIANCEYPSKPRANCNEYLPCSQKEKENIEIIAPYKDKCHWNDANLNYWNYQKKNRRLNYGR